MCKTYKGRKEIEVVCERTQSENAQWHLCVATTMVLYTLLRRVVNVRFYTKCAVLKPVYSSREKSVQVALYIY